MMFGTTVVHFIWKNGVSFAQLSKTLFDYLTRAALIFEKQSVWGVSGTGRFVVLRYTAAPPLSFPNSPWDVPPPMSEITRLHELADEPWEDDPWKKPGISNVGFHVREATGEDWGAFYARMEDSMRLHAQSLPTAVHHLTLFFDGLLCIPCGESHDEFEKLCVKYAHIKRLCGILDCDEVYAHIHEDAVAYYQQRLPHHRDKAFRFAKEGTQVLPIRMEDGRQLPEMDIMRARVFIDPPGLNALSPGEYARLNF